ADGSISPKRRWFFTCFSRRRRAGCRWSCRSGPCAEMSKIFANAGGGAMRQRGRGAAVIALLAACAAPAAAQTFSQVIVFGASSVEAGAYKVRRNPMANAAYNSLWPAAVAAGAGAPTSSPGLMNSQVLASYFGLTADPFNGPSGGTNFATSGAKA